MRYARALTNAAQTLLNEERTGLQQEKEGLDQARRHLQDQEDQIGAARQKVSHRAKGIAADLRRIAEMRKTLGLDGHPEFDALIARYPRVGPAGGRGFAAPQQVLI